MNSNNPISLGVAILAAGASSRMGRPKMLLPWNGTTVLGHLVSQWQRLAAAQIAVVCAAGDTAIEAELARIGVGPGQRILNPEPARGMFSSIQCAARWAGGQPALTHGVIALGDQPNLADETLRAVLAFVARNASFICQPARHGCPRHPVFLPRRFLEPLANAPQATLKEFLQAHGAETRRLEVSDDELDLDLDTPADYEKALRARGQ